MRIYYPKKGGVTVLPIPTIIIIIKMLLGK